MGMQEEGIGMQSLTQARNLVPLTDSPIPSIPTSKDSLLLTSDLVNIYHMSPITSV